MEFIEFAKQYGLIIDEAVADGKIHRVPIDTGKRGSKDGAYCLYNDEGGIAGWLQNHKTGEYVTYCADKSATSHIVTNKSKSLTAAEIKDVQDQVAKKALYLINNIFSKVYSHPYLSRKDIKPHGIYIDKNGALVIPLKNIYGDIRSFQRIEESGKKAYITGGEKNGCFFQFGAIAEKVIICEGFSTGASIFESTGIATVSAMDASNLEKVAIAIRNRYGSKLDILIAGDDDHTLPINRGKRDAEKAALSCGGRYILPNFTEQDKDFGFTDFNDLTCVYGKLKTREQIKP